VPVDHNLLASQNQAALVTTATSQPALRTGFAMLGLVSLLDLPKADRADRVVALGGAAAAGWFLVKGRRQASRSLAPSSALTRRAITERRWA
jgi:hypothetical protein